MSAYIAQIGHESLGLLYFEELASGEAYEGREDLCNYNPGDGPRFKGRGVIQLTGRCNYEAFGASIGKDLDADPESVAFPALGFRASIWFWQVNNLNNWSTCSYDDFLELTRRINGGYNGLDDRLNRWYQAHRVLGCC
eukprot:NODE_973_length_1081_cov_93.061845_g929_i0.p1 GENE.NODE_973_length_1081_cov_93.061845_g929_i0~~NODE_973_length_1081_cov_93.061845_g929_i0.p1  ORF type:complete len:138 (-),score=14.97 NODE_973_length_1081_cov_93.061845_g929_i0:55-468(-)